MGIADCPVQAWHCIASGLSTAPCACAAALPFFSLCPECSPILASIALMHLVHASTHEDAVIRHALHVICSICYDADEVCLIRPFLRS